MKFEEKVTNYYGQSAPKQVYKETSLKKAYIPSYNHTLLRRATTTRIDLEKMNYNSKLIWENERANLEEQEVFQRKTVSLFRYYYILFERLDWIFLSLD